MESPFLRKIGMKVLLILLWLKLSHLVLIRNSGVHNSFNAFDPSIVGWSPLHRACILSTSGRPRATQRAAPVAPQGGGATVSAETGWKLLEKSTGNVRKPWENNGKTIRNPQRTIGHPLFSGGSSSLRDYISWWAPTKAKSLKKAKLDQTSNFEWNLNQEFQTLRSPKKLQQPNSTTFFFCGVSAFQHNCPCKAQFRDPYSQDSRWPFHAPVSWMPERDENWKFPILGHMDTCTFIYRYRYRYWFWYWYWFFWIGSQQLARAPTFPNQKGDPLTKLDTGPLVPPVAPWAEHRSFFYACTTRGDHTRPPKPSLKEIELQPLEDAWILVAPHWRSHVQPRCIDSRNNILTCTVDSKITRLKNLYKVLFCQSVPTWKWAAHLGLTGMMDVDWSSRFISGQNSAPLRMDEGTSFPEQGQKHASLTLYHWVCWSRCCRIFLSARCFKISSISWRIHFPFDRKERRTVVSMSLVKPSAICAALCTQRVTTPSFERSRMTKASRAVRCSVHWGMDVFCNKSWRLLQSTTANAWRRDFQRFVLVFSMQQKDLKSRPSAIVSNSRDPGVSW